MAGPEGIVEWFKGSALRPFVDALDGGARETFLADYTARIAKAYPARYDGKVLLRFPRLFIVAVR
jgi:trans-aconitate 2-methyltransferase